MKDDGHMIVPELPFDWNDYQECTDCHEMFEKSEAVLGSTRCPDCLMKGRKKGLKAQRRKEAMRVLVTTLVNDGRAEKINVPHIAEATAELVGMFGGVTGFAKQWYDQLQHAMSANPGSVAVLRSMEGIAKLIKWSTQMRGTAPDAHGLSDDELQRELLQMVGHELDRMQKDPAQQQLVEAMSGADDDE